MQNGQRLGDHLVEHVGGPCAAGAVDPVGVVAVGEGNVGGAWAERVQCREHLVGELGIVVVALAGQAVQEHQQRAVGTDTCGCHQGQRHRAAHEPAINRQMQDPRPLRVHRRWRARAAMPAPGSVAVTGKPSAASGRVAWPVPQPTSSTGDPLSMPVMATRSANSSSGYPAGHGHRARAPRRTTGQGRVEPVLSRHHPRINYRRTCQDEACRTGTASHRHLWPPPALDRRIWPSHERTLLHVMHVILANNSRRSSPWLSAQAVSAAGPTVPRQRRGPLRCG